MVFLQMWEYFLLFYHFWCSITPMKHTIIKILTLAALCISFVFATSLFASNDVTSQSFMVNLSNMDPLGP